MMAHMTQLHARGRQPPTPPSIAHWPPIVRTTETLRGTLVRCGPGHRLAAWPESPITRALALAPWFSPDRTAIRSTAAWIWGATRRPGPALEFSAQLSHRVFAIAGSTGDVAVELHRFTLSADEIEHFSQARVTSPLRTVCDLLRQPSGFGRAQQIACRLLMLRVPSGRSAVMAALEAGGRVHRRTALSRLAWV